MKNIFKRKIKQLPPEGSIYTHIKKDSAYNGMSGIVEHHADGKAFMIKTETSVLVNIKIF